MTAARTPGTLRLKENHASRKGSKPAAQIPVRPANSVRVYLDEIYELILSQRLASITDMIASVDLTNLPLAVGVLRLTYPYRVVLPNWHTLRTAVVARVHPSLASAVTSASLERSTKRMRALYRQTPDALKDAIPGFRAIYG